jgi:hypothetical protein
VAFSLLTPELNGNRDFFATFVHTRKTGTTSRVSADSFADPEVVTARRSDPSISANGRFVAFISNAIPVPGNIIGINDVFVQKLALNASGHDRNDNDDESAKDDDED